MEKVENPKITFFAELKPLPAPGDRSEDRQTKSTSDHIIDITASLWL
jgi:hypothetical protein